MNNGRPLSARKKVQFLVALTLLAWATQTLMAQWSRGAEVDVRHAPAAAAGSTAFVPAAAAGAGATLELRGEAKVYGAEVKLKQVCRWSDADAAMFAPVAELVIAKLDGRRPFRVMDVQEVRETLGEAGINVALVRFAGPVECKVERTDVKLGEGEALDAWIKEQDRAQPDAEQPVEPQPAAARQPADAGDGARRRVVREPETRAEPAEHEDEPGVRTLKSVLVADLAVRLALPADDLQVAFSPRDENVLNLAEPNFRFDVQPRRVRDLGEVSWDVTVVSGPAGSRKAQIRATARAWQNQVVVTRSLARGQVIQESDITARRTLVDRLPGAALLAAEQVIGQIAARELKPGTLVTAPLVEAVPLAKLGQFITITLDRGNVRIKSVGKALEGGSYGETIRVKNEATKDVYQVVLTGPQEATMAPPPAASAPAAEPGVASVGR